MSELKPVPCDKCGELPEVQDKRIRFVLICDCETPTNYVCGSSVGFLDHIENEEAAQIAFDAINVNELKRTAIEAWNKEQELLRLTAIATKHATLNDERYELLEKQKSDIEKMLDQLFRHDKVDAWLVCKMNDMLDDVNYQLDKSRIEAENGDGICN